MYKRKPVRIYSYQFDFLLALCAFFHWIARSHVSFLLWMWHGEVSVSVLVRSVVPFNHINSNGYMMIDGQVLNKWKPPSTKILSTLWRIYLLFCFSHKALCLFHSANNWGMMGEKLHFVKLLIFCIPNIDNAVLGCHTAEISVNLQQICTSFFSRLWGLRGLCKSV